LIYLAFSGQDSDDFYPAGNLKKKFLPSLPRSFHVPQKRDSASSRHLL